jgi:hypothetical protein
VQGVQRPSAKWSVMTSFLAVMERCYSPRPRALRNQKRIHRHCPRMIALCALAHVLGVATDSSAQRYAEFSSAMTVEPAVASAGSYASEGTDVTNERAIQVTYQFEMRVSANVQVLAGIGLLSAVAQAPAQTRLERWSAPMFFLGVRHTLLRRRSAELGLSPLVGYLGQAELRLPPTDSSPSLLATSRGGLGAGVEVDVRYPAARTGAVVAFQGSVRYSSWTSSIGSSGAFRARPLAFGLGLVINH